MNIYCTKKELDILKDQLAILEQKDRPLASQQVAEAREKGDLKENAGYHAAREALSLLERRIAALKKQIANLQVIDEKEIDTSKIGILTSVRLRDQKSNQEIVYRLVSSQEANWKAGQLSIDSPVGKGLLGKKRGDTATIKIPAGNIVFEVLDIFVEDPEKK